MAIVKQRNKKTGVIYVYESHSYRDKATKQPRSKRKLIGRIDEATGKVVPTRKRKKTGTTDGGDGVATTSPPEEAPTLDIVKEAETSMNDLRREAYRLRKGIQSISKELDAVSERLRNL